jgi:hypothetical protein
MLPAAFFARVSLDRTQRICIVFAKRAVSGVADDTDRDEIVARHSTARGCDVTHQCT